MRRLRVVHLTLGLDVGGQEKLLVEFARHADRSRFELTFVSLTSRGALAGDLEACGWPVVALEASPGVRPGLVWRLARLFGHLNADVVHTHDDRPNVHGAPAARLAGVGRVIHTRHSQGTRLTRRQQWLVRAASEFTDRFVCISADSARYAVAQGISRRRVVDLPNGIDLDRFAHSGPAAQGAAVIVARLAPEKDVGTLLEAAALVARRHDDFRLLVAGDGPCRAELEAQGAQLGLQKTVKFLGVVRDVPALLLQGRLFVLSSITEGVSLTLLEAMARGLPIVATAVGGNPEVVAANETGLLVPPQNPAALAEALSLLWTHSEMCVKMGSAGRRRVESLFDVRRMVTGYEAIYTRT
jgi:glycosyltransferase involved in cell wall biosynthesis